MLYRLFEILPALLTWATLVAMFLFSAYLPTAVAVFIILFDIYWLLKTFYLSFHLRTTFTEMRKNLKIDWIAELDKLEKMKSDPNNPNFIRMPQIVEKELSYALTGIFFKVQNQLGRFCRERQYGDVLAKELEKRGIKFKRELPISVAGRKSNFVDFLIEDKIAVELKAKAFIQKEDYYQIQRYLRSANLELGLLVNFQQPVLKPKRILNPNYNCGIRGVRINSDFSDRLRDWKDVYHLIILPTYREPYEVLRESLQSLAAAVYPKDKMFVVLATEERAGEEAMATADKIKEEFGGVFGKFLTTVHPQNLPGEIPGKGSNETWAAREAKRLIIDPLIGDTNNPNSIRMSQMAEPSNIRGIRINSDFSDRLPYEQILVSVFDVDTQIYPHYFGRLTYVFLNAAHPYRSSYQPIPLFTNNVYQVPALARIVSFSSTFWQMMQQSRSERLTTFSSQSLPFQTLLDIGYWETNMVSEDSRVFWQCFLRYDGDFRVEPLLYPVSMDANAGPTFWQTMANLYRQQRRWAWGAENIPYMLTGFLKSAAISWRKKLYWTFNVIEGFHSWATNSLMIFALGWLPLFLGGERFNYSMLSYNLPQITRWIIQISMVGIVTSAIVSILLLPPREKEFRFWHYFIYFFQWVLLPITLIVFGAIPAIEAQTRLMLGGRFRLGFWVTPKTREGVGEKR